MVAAAAGGAVQLQGPTASALHDGLWLVVNGNGTGGRGKIPGLDVSGKTGTAQVISLQGSKAAAARGSTVDLRDHGWFVFFAPRDNPEIAGVIFAEHAEHGYLGAPIAKHMIATYFAKKRGEPLPVFTAPGYPAAPASGRSAARARRAAAHCGRGRGRRWEADDAVHRATAVLSLRLAAAGHAARHLLDGHHDDLQRDAGDDAAAVHVTGLRTRSRIDRAARGRLDRLPDTGGQVALDLRPHHRLAAVRDLFRRRPRRRTPLDSARRLQPAAVGIREDCGGAGAGEVLRRQPARLADRRRPSDRRGALCGTAPAHRQAARPRHRGHAAPCLTWPSRSSRDSRCACSASWRWPASWSHPSRGSSR